MLLDRKTESDDVFFTLLRFLGAKDATRDPKRLNELLHSLGGQTAHREK
ncbi:hypothetical protein [Streptomyces scopuliridis]